jgi:hypothetical protein
MPPITKELVKANPGVTSFIAGGTYNIPVKESVKPIDSTKSVIIDSTPISNSSYGILGKEAGKNNVPVMDGQKETPMIKNPFAFPVEVPEIKAGLKEQPIPKIAAKPQKGSVKTNYPATLTPNYQHPEFQLPAGSRARGNEPTKLTFVPNKYGLVDQNYGSIGITDRGRPTAEQLHLEHFLKNLTIWEICYLEAYSKQQTIQLEPRSSCALIKMELIQK